MGLPGGFDRMILHMGSNQVIADTNVFQNPSNALASVFTGNDLFLNGMYALEANNQVNPRIYAPAVFAFGSSVTHLDQASYPAGDTNSLMTPFIGTAEAVHHPGPITLGLFRDMGWPLSGFTSLENPLPVTSLSAYPNPFKEELFFRFQLEKASAIRLEVIDPLGRILWFLEGVFPAGKQEVKAKPEEWGRVSKGLYLYRLSAEGQSIAGKLLHP